MKINNKILIMEVLLCFIFFILGVFLCIYVPDGDGRDQNINLHDGYILVSVSSKEQSLIYWDAEEEMQTGDGEQILLKGYLSQYQSTTEYIVIFDEKQDQYLCFDKKSKENVKTVKTLNKMRSYISKKYGDDLSQLSEL